MQAVPSGHGFSRIQTESAVYGILTACASLWPSSVLSFLNCENCVADDYACDVCWPVSEACTGGHMGRNFTQCVPWKEDVSIQCFSFGCVSVPMTVQPDRHLSWRLSSHFYINQCFRLAVFGQELEKRRQTLQDRQRTNTGKKWNPGSHSISKNLYSRLQWKTPESEQLVQVRKS